MFVFLRRTYHFDIFVRIFQHPFQNKVSEKIVGLLSNFSFEIERERVESKTIVY